jgi:NAD(P) transhydrogenase subunit alpha
LKITVPKETAPGERRVALFPTNVTQLRKLGHEVAIESGAGVPAGYPDEAYVAVGATVAATRTEALSGDLVLQVRGLGANPENGKADTGAIRKGQILIGLHEPLWRPEHAKELAGAGATVAALETLPRISRAQSMDVLSSMATISGYKAVLVAADSLPIMFPMLMTAAGTLQAARVFVLGAGVAGLQAIATARRLGAVVEGYDIRPAAAEQIRSLGAKAVELPLETADAEDKGGYAKQQGEAQQQRQQELLASVIAGSDVVITTAAIPGAPSPRLISRAMVDGMKPGTVIVDLAAERGGNCELTVADQRVDHHGVTILGPTDLASLVPRHASQMYGNNLTTLIKHWTKEGVVSLDFADEITNGVVVAHDGEVRNSRMREKLGLAPLQAPAVQEA